MKILLAAFLLPISAFAFSQQTERTYTGSSTMGRTEACRDARSSAELFAKNSVSCPKPNVSISNCDCEFIPEGPRTIREHKCLVVAKISCDSR